MLTRPENRTITVHFSAKTYFFKGAKFTAICAFCCCRKPMHIELPWDWMQNVLHMHNLQKYIRSLLFLAKSWGTFRSWTYLTAEIIVASM